ncbi:MAG TPA: tRNA (N(6)-L-threonylcarbamoyladenosine(37)-C(2))-methylthiotransferase MtaB [Tepidisphaeraceae bacterium]|jgi:threonylcarbamoyladenosine tRNA methylthiotransferase MtaB
MRTFSIQTLGCKVNQYESEQIASLLRSYGWVESDAEAAELRIINSCSVTVEAASKSRQFVRRAAKLPGDVPNVRVIVMGCWATSDREAASSLPGVDLVLTHKDNVAQRLKDFLSEETMPAAAPLSTSSVGTRSLPLLGERQAQHQRAFLKIQDGCDAHCTYCIIPRLRTSLWSKPPAQLLQEARQLVAAGHIEIVLTGIFLSAYGQETALRRRQSASTGNPLAKAIEMLCTRVPRLRRLRLSSLEPGDLDDELLQVLRSHPQVVPHFHLPLQSGSSAILRKMNRQYTRDDFLRLLDRIDMAFDGAALTTDIIVGFPGETDADFQETLDVVDRARFIHMHVFPFSPRPGTAAARWESEFVRGPIVGQRIDMLRRREIEFSHTFRSSFIGQSVQLLVEREGTHQAGFDNLRHGRCPRYFDVHFESDDAETGDLVEVRIDRVTPTRTFGTLVSIAARRTELCPA